MKVIAYAYSIFVLPLGAKRLYAINAINAIKRACSFDYIPFILHSITEL